MSCYFRHMKGILEEAGIVVTPKNKKEVDRIIHGIMEVEYKNCSPAWKAIKEKILGDDKTRKQFMKKLKGSLKTI
ncbi:MAG: hypothetical protein AB1585_12645 [Thermodesulfobacteriota bacterium]